MKRFISEDPIGLGGGLNFYAYTQNNPVNFTDPLGFQSMAGTWVNYGKGGGNWLAGEVNDRDYSATFKLGKCWVKCMVVPHGKIPPPVAIHAGLDLIKHGLKHSKYMRFAGPVGVIGWGVFGFESFQCLLDCGDDDEC